MAPSSPRRRSKPTRQKSARTCPSMDRPSTRSAAARRRSRRRSRWRVPTTSLAASRSVGSSSPAGAAITATRSVPSTCRADGRCAGHTRPGWVASATSVRRTHIALGSRAPMPSRALTKRPLSWARCSSWPGRAPSPRSSASRSWAPTLAAAEPPDGYWPAIAEVCREHGVLLIADDVMTGFGRTGTWFGMDHFGVRPDILVAAKGATSGYWPFGFAAANDEVATALERGGFTHGFTYSHHVVGAAVAREVLRILETESLVEASAIKGAHLRRLLEARLGDHPNVGQIRGRGLLQGIELVADRETRAPFPRAARLTETILAEARSRGVLFYSGTGNADGVDGDQILVGPPFVITDAELETIVDALSGAVEAAVAGIGAMTAT